MASQQLRYFLEVAQSGSVRLAGEHLNVAASALSRQIQNLELEIGMPLFERRPRGMVLTPAGEIYARYAHALTLEKDRVVSEIEELRGLKRGLVRIHSVEGVISDVVTESIARFRARHPGVRFKLVASGTDDVVAAVREGLADVGVSFNAQPDPMVHCVRRFDDPVEAVVRPGHELAGRARVSLVELARFPVALPEAGFGIRRLVDEACRRLGMSLTPMLETNSIEALRGFARTGAGVSILPRTSCRRELKAGAIATISFADEALRHATMDLSVLAGRRLPPATAAFLTELEQSLAANA
ncbi:MAG: LysR family transcriptional regulator [Microvirga sp.]|nr:LysR family transcriptional regulator [Microvirga sp.]